MPVDIFGQDIANSWTFTPNSGVDYGDSVNSHSWSLPAGSTYLAALLGCVAHTPVTNMSPDTLTWQFSQWGGVSLTKRAETNAAVDGEAFAGIATLAGPAAGSQTINSKFDDCAPAYGNQITLGLRGVDTSLPSPVFAIDQHTDNNTSISTSFIVDNPNLSLLSIMVVRANVAVAKTLSGNAQVLMDQLDATGTCRTVAVHVTGSKPLSASFSWSGSYLCAIASVVLYSVSGGIQVCVIG